ncbi:acetyl-CoA carboxylase carboxyl transferase subunit beta [Pseudobutyrivibrio sp. 49]|uniref:acetyl-CoA carboxylase carboxyltransferase subunit beta n=1 Tax=Pseudobutyrivibrio sp. 49 TaxID=1855344 RepID=UPI00088D965D|nr:acetyl-CoA carboxylase carboxyltransferase subunit beta [Pseudobutyrivibrio sp. 49]SDI62394.1 acetyl-CoA carboxylase carboxyl transferase subunit beta [Pseudobutyrivibrio sp. 49]
MNVVDERKEKFNRYKELRENPEEVLAPVIKPVAEYTIYDRIKDIADTGTFKAFNYDFPETNPLEFDGYVEKKEELREECGCHDGIIAGKCKIGGYPVVLAVMNKKFMMASMGIELGETVCRAAEYAMSHKLPLIIFTASGGARMQEGILSLMQMAKTSAVIEKFKNNGGLYITVLTHPTTGGVSASFATLGDITLAEPGALIGFAGPRVIEQTIGQTLPEGFQRAEFLEEHGFVDQVVRRDDIKATLTKILMLHQEVPV